MKDELEKRMIENFRETAMEFRDQEREKEDQWG
jgi:hypothetical protein